MPTLSKLSKNVKCNEFIHPWTNKCSKAIWLVFFVGIKESLKIYSTLYLVSSVIFKRKRFDIFALLKTIFKSSSFLTLNGGLMIVFSCLIRRFLTYKQYSIIFIPSFIASWVSVCIENPSRRQQLTVYMANVAAQTFHRVLKNRGIMPEIMFGEVFVFSCASSYLMTLFIKNELPNQLDGILKFLFGHQEKQEKPIEWESINGSIETEKEIKEIISDPINKYMDQLTRIPLIRYKSSNCLHKRTCLIYSIFGGIKPALFGVTIQYIMLLLRSLKYIVVPRKLIVKIFKFDNLKFGLFLGSFSILFRFLQCLQRSLFKKANSIFSGFLAGACNAIYPSTALSMYIFSKATEVFCQNYFHKYFFMRRFKHEFIVLIYSLATAFVMHEAFIEPNTVPKTYFNFLKRMTKDLIVNIDRSYLE